MKTIATKMKSYTGNINIMNNNNIEKRILNMMLFIFCALCLCYVLFLSNIVFNIIERKALEVSVRTLTNEVGGLQSEYFSASNKVNLSLADSMGFKPVNNKTYAVRKSIGSLRLVNNEL
ncbi:MAG: hypothetical protein WCX46_02025 [Candidatus Paceibacterota bacterium]